MPEALYLIVIKRSTIRGSTLDVGVRLGLVEIEMSGLNRSHLMEKHPKRKSHMKRPQGRKDL